MTSRTYSLILLLPVVILALLALGLKFYLEPLEGDLTRLGSYKESDYGWNNPLPVSTNETVSYARYPNQNTTYYPVVVVGDSFSYFRGKRNFGWQQLLADYSGLDSVTYDNGIDSVTYDRKNVGVEAFIESEHYNKQPPALLIFQFVERRLPWIASMAPTSCPTVQSPVIEPSPIVTAIKDINFGIYKRPKRLVGLDETIHFLLKKLSFKKRVWINDLTREDLFSSKLSSQLLWFYEDLDKFKLKDTDLEKVGCYLSYLQNSVQSNGKTRFLIMIPPDKTTIYGRYFKKAPFEIRDMIGPIARPGLNLLRLDHSLSLAAENGIEDIYLPNDTHWGFVGNNLATKSVIDFLTH
jgi:hypothetical protein